MLFSPSAGIIRIRLCGSEAHCFPLSLAHRLPKMFTIVILPLTYKFFSFVEETHIALNTNRDVRISAKIYNFGLLDNHDL